MSSKLSFCSFKTRLHFHLTFFFSPFPNTRQSSNKASCGYLECQAEWNIIFKLWETHIHQQRLDKSLRSNKIPLPHNHGVLVLYPMVFVVTAYAQYGVLTICSGILWDTMNISNISPRVIVAFKFKKISIQL